MLITMRACIFLAVALLAVPLIVNGLSSSRSACYAVDYRLDDESTDLAEVNPASREQALLERIAALESTLERQVAANTTLTAEIERKARLLATQDKQIQRMIENLANATEKNADLSARLVEEAAQRRRATIKADRLMEQLRVCEAERDALAAELAQLQANDD